MIRRCWARSRRNWARAHSIRNARLHDVLAIRALRVAAAAELTRRAGHGHWSGVSFFPILHRAIFGGSLFVIEEEGRLLASFTLDTIVADYCKPEWFTHPADPAFYLRSLSVRVDAQGRGVGRAAMAEAENLARKRGMKALRCDAYEGAASAGGFYEKCGFKPLRRGAVNGTPIVFYEKLLRG